MWAALVTMIVGILGAIAQTEIKRMLSFTLVSHIGYMIFGVALATTAGYAGAIFYTAHHITIQTTLFLVLGLVEVRAGSTSLARLGELAALSPLLGILFFVPAMNLAGIPPFSGFVGKVGLLDAGVQHGGVLAYVLVGGGVVTSLLTLYAMAKVWNRAFWRPLRTEADELETTHLETTPPGTTHPGTTAAEGGEPDEGADDLPESRRLPWPMVATTVVLVLVGVGLTVVAGPLYGYAQRSAADLVGGAAYVRAVLPGGIR
jgi:multicomponent Na+:H+ antiporter subunit D